MSTRISDLPDNMSESSEAPEVSFIDILKKQFSETNLIILIALFLAGADVPVQITDVLGGFSAYSFFIKIIVLFIIVIVSRIILEDCLSGT